MRAIYIEACGDADQLRYGDLPTPNPGPGEVLVRVAFAGVNPADWKCREGKLVKYYEYRFPFVLGFEGSGTIEAIGPGVADLRPGQRVTFSSQVAVGAWGAYAEYALAYTQGVVPIPDSLPLEAAATIVTAGGTAWGALMDVGQAKSGQSVFIHGASGGVGSYAVSLARGAGLRIAGSASKANLDYVAQLGADCCIDYRAGDMSDALKAFAPDGVDLIVDCVGLGTLPKDAAKWVRPGGRIICIETLIEDIEAFDLDYAKSRQVDIRSNMEAIMRLPDHIRAVAAALSEGRATPPPIQVMPLAKAADAHNQVQSGHTRGKIVLAVG